MTLEEPFWYPASFPLSFSAPPSAFTYLSSPELSIATPESAPAIPVESHSRHGLAPPAFTINGPTHDLAAGPGHFTSSQSAPASPEASAQPGACRICGDKATGKHYGALSCDGCKGFFRRTIRKNQRYVCRYNKSCTIDKDKRNSCRYCRYRKCLGAGMKREAVQNERDRISNRRVMGSTQENIEMLLAAEQVCVNLRSSVIHALPHHRQAGTTEISESIKQQLLLLVEWAKNLPVFSRFAIREQASLLRCYGAQHLMLVVARRSIPYEGRLLMLGNESFLTRDQHSEVPETQRLTGRILDELVQPMQELELDDCEFVLLKAIMFFNPHAQALKSKEVVREMRQSFIASLESYVMEKYPGAKGRLGTIYLMLPSLQVISYQLVESLQAATFFGVARLDTLLHEILLGNEDHGDAAFLASHSAAGSQYAGNTELPTGVNTCNSAPTSPGRIPVLPKDEYVPNGIYQ